jgi:hypothetical protein
MSVIQLQQPARKPVTRTARRVTLNEAICKAIKPEERVLDHQAGFYAIGLASDATHLIAKARKRGIAGNNVNVATNVTGASWGTPHFVRI